MKNIYNIPSNYHFINSLSHFVIDNFNYKFSELKIFLPNQRLLRKLRENLDKSRIPEVSQIKIKAISELSIIDFYDFLPNKLIENIIYQVNQIKILNKIDAIFFILKEISNHQKLKEISKNPSFAKKYKIAKNIYDTINEIHGNQVDLSKVLELQNNSDYAFDEQLTADFFCEFFLDIQKKLASKNSMFSVQYHNFLIEKYVEILENSTEYNINQNLIIAGSTGSIKSSQQLIKAIKNYEFGSVFLYGLYNFLNQSSTFNITEIHPQFYLSKLLDFLGEDIHKIQQYKKPQFQISTDSRIDFFNQIYHSDSKKINVIDEILKNDLQNNLELYEASNQVMEAKFIAKFCLEHTNNSNKKIGIIINNQNLKIILKSFLKKYKILFNDTSSQDSLNLDLLNFIQLIFINKFNEFNSHNFLSFLKNPLFSKYFNDNFIDNFEIEILRQERTDLGLEGLFTKIKNTKYQKFIEDIFENLPKSKNLQSLIISLEYFTKNSFNNLLNQSMAGKEIADFFRSLKKISGDDFVFENLDDLKILFNEISYFEKNDKNAKIEILTPIEARNLSFDIVIITSLNQDDFPSTPSNDWIGSKIKKELEIYKNLQKIGQNNFDFCNYLSNPKIILTHCQSLMGKELVESVFLTKLATHLLKNQFSLNKTNYFNNRFFSIDKTRKYFLNYPAPTLAKTYIPNKFSATDIGDLVENPYAIYIKKILKLEPLKIIDYQASSSEFGSFVHKALEHYIKNNNTDNFLDIFNEFFASKFAKITWFTKFSKIFADFLIENFEFNDFKNITEMPISFYINEIKISGKIDRIIINNNEVAIIDYKTGEPPSKSSVLNGLSPQLLIYALGFSKNLQHSQFLSELIYWKLKINNQKAVRILDENTDIALIIKVCEQELHKIFDFYLSENNCFFATNEIKNDYFPNLTRIQEWKN